MTHRIALAAASAAAAVTLTVALAAVGFVPTPAEPATPTSSTVDASAPVDPGAEPTIQVDTIYVAPPPPQETITVHKVIKTSGGEAESENESGEVD